MKPLLAVTLWGAAMAGAQTQPSAASIMDEAKAKAAPGKRAIFLTFHASW
jgi:hypothetical protein